MFVVKDPDLFASQIIPQYFDHNKFSSFARQLNFYGFRKMQSKPIRNSDFDAGTAKHVTFYNENFKRGRCDLLKKIQRSTRGGGTTTTTESSREVQTLREQVQSLEQRIVEISNQTEERVRRLELDMLSRLEQVMVAMQQQQSVQLSPQSANSVGTASSGSQHGSVGGPQVSLPTQINNNVGMWDANNLAAFQRANSINATSFAQQLPSAMVAAAAAARPENKAMAPPTLPPHPKQKQMPPVSFPNAMGAPPDRLNSLRGISLSRGLSGLSRLASIESTASGLLMPSTFDDKILSTLMFESENGGQTEPTPMAPHAPVTVSNRSIDMKGQQEDTAMDHEDEDDLSSVSTSDMP